MDRSTRSLSRQQLEELRGLVAPSAALFRAVLFALAGLLVGKLFHILQQLLGAAAGSWWWLLPTIGIMAALYVRSGRWTGGAELRRRVRRDIAGGESVALRVEAIAATEIEEIEDEGPGFVVETAGGETILFAGQYLEEPKRRGFPWHRFEIVEAPSSGIFFRFRKLGDPLRIKSRRGPLSLAQSRRLGILEKNYVVLDAAAKAVLDDGEGWGQARGEPPPGGEHGDQDPG